MKILHLLSSSAFHGGESMTVELCRASVAAGMECHLLSFDNRGRGDMEAARRLEGVCASINVTRADRQYDPAAVDSIRSLVNRHGIDVIHSHKYKTTFHALIARRSLAAAVVTTHHNWIDESLADRVYGIIDRQMTRFVDAAVGVSEKVVARLRSTVPPQRLHLIANGVDFTAFHPTTDRAGARRSLGLDDRFTIGFVGRLTPKKGVQDLLAALSSVDAGRPVKLLVVGDGEHREELQRLAALESGRVDAVFCGNRHNVHDYYAAMDLLVLPSYEEGFPMVVLEALACAIPVIATTVGDIPKMVADGTDGWLFRPGDVSALAGLLRTAMGSGSLATMGQRGHDRVEEMYSSRRMALAYGQVYQDAITRRSNRR